MLCCALADGTAGLAQVGEVCGGEVLQYSLQSFNETYNHRMVRLWLRERLRGAGHAMDAVSRTS